MPDMKLLFLRALAASSAVFMLAAAAAPGDPMLLVAKRSFEDPVYGSTIVLARPVGGGGPPRFIVNKPEELNRSQLFPAHEPSKKVADPPFLGRNVAIELVLG